MSLETEAKDGKVLASRNDINGKKMGFEVMNNKVEVHTLKKKIQKFLASNAQHCSGEWG